MKARTCPQCTARCKSAGEAKRMPSGFVDQVVVCPKCGWVGVVSERRQGAWQAELGLDNSGERPYT